MPYNKWSYKLLILSNIYGYELVKLNPVYSSFIGNLVYGDSETPDMVAASIDYVTMYGTDH